MIFHVFIVAIFLLLSLCIFIVKILMNNNIGEVIRVLSLSTFYPINHYPIPLLLTCLALMALIKLPFREEISSNHQLISEHVPSTPQKIIQFVKILEQKAAKAREGKDGELEAPLMKCNGIIGNWQLELIIGKFKDKKQISKQVAGGTCPDYSFAKF